MTSSQASAMIRPSVRMGFEQQDWNYTCSMSKVIPLHQYLRMVKPQKLLLAKITLIGKGRHTCDENSDDYAP